MPTIAEIRQKYPQYSKMSDQDLADALHQKYYSQMPEQEFYKKIQFNPVPDQGIPEQQMQGASFQNNPMGQGLLTNLAQNFNPTMANVGRGVGQSLVNQAFQVPSMVAGGSLLGQQLEQFKPNLIEGASNPQLAKQAENVADVSQLLMAGPSAVRALPAVAKGAGKVTGISALWDKFRPEKHAEGIVQSLTKGKVGAENTQQVAKMVKDFAEQETKTYGGAFDNLFKEAADKGVKQFEKPGSTFGYGGAKSEFLENPTTIEKYLSGKEKDLYKDFIANPTPENAHWLQSQLGGMERQLIDKKMAKGLNTSQVKRLNEISGERQKLINDIEKGLQTAGIDPGLYRKAQEDFAKNVGVFSKDNDIFQMSTGSIVNPSNLASVFSDKKTINTLEEIANKIGPEFKNRIMADVITKGMKKTQASDLIANYKEAINKGLGRFITPELEEQMGNLSKKAFKKKLALYGLGATTAGAAIGKYGEKIAGALPGGSTTNIYGGEG